MQRIVLEALAVTLGRNARARAIQLPAWNEALGLPRPWDQQWSLRIQQVLAYETDLLEYPDIFEGSKVMDGLVAELLAGRARGDGARGRAGRRRRGRAVHEGGAGGVAPRADPPDRVRRAGDGRRQPLRGDRAVAADRRRAGSSWSTRRSSRRRATRSSAGAQRAATCRAALEELRRVAASDENIMPATIAAARAGVTTGEWAGALREAFGSYRGADRRRRGGRAGRRRGAGRAARRGRARRRRARAPRQDPGRQARPRRALQRRRADRRAGARRRHGRRLRGHPPHPRPDRPLGGRRGRPRDRPLDPLRLAPRADPRRDRGARRRGHPRRGRRDHPRGRRRRAQGRPAWPPSTRRRTSRSRVSCATSWGSWRTATEYARRRDRSCRGRLAGAGRRARVRRRRGHVGRGGAQRRRARDDRRSGSRAGARPSPRPPDARAGPSAGSAARRRCSPPRPSASPPSCSTSTVDLRASPTASASPAAPP